MPTLPTSEDSLLVRTDFSDDDAWGEVLSAVETENSDGFRAYVQVVEEPEWEGADWQSLRAAALAAAEHAAVLFVVDEAALAEEHPIQVVDLSEDAMEPFRCITAELWSVDNNLNLANMDWEDFANNVGDDGVFRGFV